MRYPSGAFGERCRWTVPAAGPPTRSDGSSARCAERRPARACPNCSTLNGPTARFCGECGSALGPDGPSAGPSAATSRAGNGAVAVAPARAVGPGSPVAERRLVSVLFADLVGFTTLAEGRDAEAVRELLTRYFDARAGGHRPLRRDRREVHRRRRDGGLGRADRARGRRRARGPRRARPGRRRAHARRLGADGLQARAGVLTGEAAVTIGATNQGMVAGDLVNTAVAPPVAWRRRARCSSARRPTRPPRAAIAFEPAGEQVLKGKAAPVPAWRALRVVAERGGARPERASSRRRSSAATTSSGCSRTVLHATGARRRPRLVSIIGQAGIGKSRLAWEFEKYIDGLVDERLLAPGPVTGLRRGHHASGRSARWSASRAGLAEGDDEPRRRGEDRGRRSTSTSPTRPSGAGSSRAARPARPRRRRRRRAARSCSPPGGRSSSGSREQGPSSSCSRTSSGPTTGLLDFIDHLLDWSRRPPDPDRHAGPARAPRAPAGLGRRPAELRRARARAAARRGDGASCSPASCRACPEAARRAILARAEGIPLYAVETVRMLLATVAWSASTAATA